MKHRTVICADIAKNVFQVIQFKDHKAISQNKAYKRKDFIKLIKTSKPSVLVMETCSGANHWARLAKHSNHEVVLISARTVAGFRQGQKTDANDAVAIYEAYRSHTLKPSPQKTLEQQHLATLESIRQHYQTEKTRLGNALRGLLAEFGLVFATSHSALRKNLPLILEDAENDLSDEVRYAIDLYWQDWQRAHEKVKALELQKRRALAKIKHASELLKIEGVGPVCAAQLVCALGDGLAFKCAKQAAAFIGTSPKQHSSGGKTVMVGISKATGHKRLRAGLIQGAWSIIIRLKARGKPVSDKERWLLQLMERVGENRAAVALANKNVRTAWAVLAYEREYIAA